MSRLKLKFIFSWVNSHIADYPKLLLLFRYYSDLTTITKVAIFVFFVSLFLLVLISPSVGIIFLLSFTLYLFYKKKYKIIFLIWGKFFFIWYLVFTACLISYDGPIIIRPGFFGKCYVQEDMEMYDETVHLFFYFLNSNFFLERFFMETFFFLCGISMKFKVTIYVPSLLKGILALLKFLFGGKGGSSASCSPEEKSSNDSPPSWENNGGTRPSWKDYSSDIGGKEKTPKPSEEFKFDTPTPSPRSVFNTFKPQTFDFGTCSELKRLLDKAKPSYVPVGMKSTVVKGRKFTYGEFGVWSGCFAKPASPDEVLKEKLFREFKKTEKKS